MTTATRNWVDQARQVVEDDRARYYENAARLEAESREALAGRLQAYVDYLRGEPTSLTITEVSGPNDLGHWAQTEVDGLILGVTGVSSPLYAISECKACGRTAFVQLISSVPSPAPTLPGRVYYDGGCMSPEEARLRALRYIGHALESGPEPRNHECGRHEGDRNYKPMPAGVPRPPTPAEKVLEAIRELIGEEIPSYLS